MRLLLLALLLAGAAVRAQPAAVPDAVRRAADRITADQLARDLDYLASDELEGRNTPSPGLEHAAEYIAKRLEKAGLEPLGDAGGFIQRYTMRESHVDTAAAAIEVGGRRFRHGDDFVVRSFAGALRGQLPVVYVGHGWTIPDRGIDPYAGVDVKGKLVLAHGPRALPRDVEVKQIGRVSVGASSVFAEADKRGAAGIIFIPVAGALDAWDRMRTQNIVVRELDPRVPSAYAAQPITSVLVQPPIVEALLAGERVTGAQLSALGDRKEYPASFELGRQVTVNVPAASTTTHRPPNVVALLKGSDPTLRDEYVTVASHLDGAVGTEAQGGDRIYNSADDNASGSAGTLAIAEHMATAARPKRSVVFIWDSGEERGLWGTRHFVHHPPVPLDKIAVHFNVDMIGANRAPGSPDASAPGVTGANEVYVIGPGVLSAGADALVDQVNRGYLNLRLNREHDRAEQEFFYPRTDAGPFLERGILTIGFTTGIHDRYHAPSDEARFLDPRKMEAITRTVFATVWAFADATERPRIDRGIPASVPSYLPRAGVPIKNE